MTAADSLQSLLTAAAEAGARKALEQVTSGPQTRWIPLRESPLGYRATLDLIRCGELTTHGIGNRKFLDREMVNRWLLEHPILNSSETPAEADELEGIIASNRARKARRKGAGQ